MRRHLIPLLLLALACGSTSNYKDSAAKCASPRSGTDPYTGRAYPDQRGSLNDEKTWLRGWINDFYLWYSEVPNVDASRYNNILDYFAQLKTPAVTASAKPKDQFHFTYTTSDWEALSQSGVEAGYGVRWALVSRSKPRLAYAAYTEPNSPATNAPASLARGAQVISVDGALVVDGDANVLNAGMFPVGVGEPHTFVVQDRGAPPGTTRTFTMTSAATTSVPVKNVGFLPNPNPAIKVGYMLFNAHIATAEKGLIDGVKALQGATDLVLDLRYNGGGYLILASELAYMIAKPSVTSGKTFEKTVFNGKYPNSDPINPSNPLMTPFQSTAVGLSGTAGQALPHLDLDRVFVLVGGGTCSASESVINGLQGVGLTVNLIGHTSCGKPYGFYPADNCGTTFFSIQFQGVNDKGFGDYADGFTPSGSSTAGGGASLPGCLVADDFSRDLGDPLEGRLAAALGFRSNGSCPAASSRGEARIAEGEDVMLVRNPFLENRILWRPQ
jgi:hypothetical protein